MEIFGIVLNSHTMSASLPATKVQEMLQKILEVQRSRSITLKKLQSIIGSLNWACAVIVPGRAFLRRLIDLTIGVTNPSHHINLTRSVRLDFKMWSTFLSQFNHKCIFLPQKWITSYKLSWVWYISVSKRCCIIFRNGWTQFQLPDNIAAVDIVLQNIFAIFVSLSLMATQWKDKCILLLHSNKTIVEVIKKCTHKNVGYMYYVRKIVMLCLQHNIYLSAKQISNDMHNKNNDVSNFQRLMSELLLNMAQGPMTVPAHCMN